MAEEEKKELNMESLFTDLFQSSTGTGDEELLRIATNYSRQLSSKQIKCLMFLKFSSNFVSLSTQQVLENFIGSWLELKQYNNSDAFVMRALAELSLKKFLGENSIKVNVEKS